MKPKAPEHVQTRFDPADFLKLKAYSEARQQSLGASLRQLALQALRVETGLSGLEKPTSTLNAKAVGYKDGFNEGLKAATHEARSAISVALANKWK